MSGRLNYHVLQPVPGSIRFRIVPQAFVEDPAIVVPHALLEGLPLQLEETPEFGICARSDRYTLLFEGPTGSFRVLNADESLLVTGLLRTDPDEPPRVAFFLQPQDRLYGLGGAIPAGLRPALSQEPSVEAALPVLLIQRAETWILILVRDLQPLRCNFRGDAHAGVEIAWPESAEAQAVDLVVCAGSLAEVHARLQELWGSVLSPRVELLGCGRTLTAERPEQIHALLDESEPVPCDYIILSGGYQEGPRVFTWNRAFQGGSLVEVRAALQEPRRLLLLGIEPAVHVEDGYRTYQQGLDGKHFCQTDGGHPFQGSGPGGPAVLPDLPDEGCLGWWTRCGAEMLSGCADGLFVSGALPSIGGSGEGAPRERICHKGGSHLRLRNAYPALFATAAARSSKETAPEHRPAALVDTARSGVHRSAGVLLPTRSDPDALREALERVLGLSMSGVPFVGLMSPEAPARSAFRRREHFLRRVEVSSLCPLFLLSEDEVDFISHGDGELRALVRKHLRRRSRLLPYINTHLQRARLEGTPMLLPLSAHFPAVDAEEARQQFMVGPDLLVAPLFGDGESSAPVYLPEGRWYEFETGRSYTGGEVLEVPVELGYYPLFVRAGAILPQCPVRDTARESLRSALLLDVYPAQTVSGSVILDDGQTATPDRFELKLTGQQEHNGELAIKQEVVVQDYRPPFREVRYRIPGQYRYATADGERREGFSENLVREDRVLDVYSHDLEISAGVVRFLYSGAWQF